MAALLCRLDRVRALPCGGCRPRRPWGVRGLCVEEVDRPLCDEQGVLLRLEGLLGLGTVQAVHFWRREPSLALTLPELPHAWLDELGRCR